MLLYLQRDELKPDRLACLSHFNTHMPYPSYTNITLTLDADNHYTHGVSYNEL
jgi:hypothetical protein